MKTKDMAIKTGSFGLLGAFETFEGDMDTKDFPVRGIATHLSLGN